MKVLDLRFKVDNLSSEARSFKGVLNEELRLRAFRGSWVIWATALRARGRLPPGVLSTVAVIVDGQVSIQVGFDCTRCLSSRSVEISIRQITSGRRGAAEGKQEIVLSDDDADDLEETYEGDEVDLTELFRQDLVLVLPMNPAAHWLGRDCAYVENAHQTEEERIDPRWAPFGAKKKLN